MDTAQYQTVIKDIIRGYARLRPSHGNIRLDVVFDDTHGRYALMQCGWDRGRRVRGNLIYVLIQDGKIVIEYDGIEQGISDDFIRAGVDEGDIVLAFLEDPQIAQAA